MESVVGWLLKCSAVYFIYHEVDLAWQLPASNHRGPSHLVSAVICLSWPCYKIMCKCLLPFFHLFLHSYTFTFCFLASFFFNLLNVLPGSFYDAFLGTIFSCLLLLIVFFVWLFFFWREPFTLRGSLRFIINVCAQFLN